MSDKDASEWWNSAEILVGGSGSYIFMLPSKALTARDCLVDAGLISHAEPGCWPLAKNIEEAERFAATLRLNGFTVKWLEA